MKRLPRWFLIVVLVVVQSIWLSYTAQAAFHIDPVELQQSLKSGDVTVYLEELYQSQLDNGVRNCIPLSLLLIDASRVARAESNHANALIFAEYARRCSPDFPAAGMFEQLIRWQSNPLMVHRLLTGFVQGYVLRFNTVNELSFYAFVQCAVLGAALVVTIAGLGLISLVRNSRLLAHDIAHILPQAFSPHATTALLILLCILPLLFGLSLLWLFPYWLLLFWSYHSYRERAVIGILILVFVLVLPLLAVSCSYFLFIPQSDRLQRLWQANYGYATKHDMDQLEQDAAAHPDDYVLIFSAGLFNKREQNYTTALSYYNRLLRERPRDFRVSINAGNVYFATGLWKKAVEKYQAAITAEPVKSAAAHFNLTRAYQQKFMFNDAEKSLINAKQLDPPRVEAYLNIYSENYNRLLIDEIITPRELWKRGFDEFLHDRRHLNSIWNVFFAGLPLPFGTIAVLALLLLNLIFSVSDSFRVATRCTLCGKVMCLRCQRTIAADILCFQCQNFLKKQEQLSFKQKDEKKAQIRNHVRIFKNFVNILSIVLPGMAHVWKGRYVPGVIYSFIFFWFFFQAVFALTLRDPWRDIGSLWIFSCSLYTLISLLIWFVLRMHIRTVKSVELEDNIMLTSLGLDS
jgi:tetratricopeptide (TPR) repeat protein